MTTKNLAVALIKFHDSGAAAKKGADNPFFKSKYANLEEVIETVRAEAGKVGLTFTQLVDFDEHHIFVTTILMHESGESVTGRTPVLTKDNTDPQKMGSGITYAKRYGLQAAFGLPSEDDDGNAASVSNPKVQKVTKKQEADDAWD
tara:strand:+ start:5609 stop:6046 length:438 start_codon:yes stop_codon:yes gene_type:complete